MPNYVYGSESDFDLYHYGVLGMKWGIRRYQKKDGTYTQAGVARYRKAESAYKHAKNSVEEKAAKREMKWEYKNLKRSYRADKGKKLSDQNHLAAGTGKQVAKKVVKTLAIGSLAIPVASSFLGGVGLGVATASGLVSAAELPVAFYNTATGANMISAGSTFISAYKSAKLVKQHQDVNIYKEEKEKRGG